jgi:hypothetical protein
MDYFNLEVLGAMKVNFIIAMYEEMLSSGTLSVAILFTALREPLPTALRKAIVSARRVATMRKDVILN